MSSVDGRLIDGRWTAPYEAERSDLLKVYAAIGRELNTDAWMFGKNTVRATFTYRFGIAGHTISSDEPAVFIGERHSERMFIVADPEGDIYFTSPTLRGDNMLEIHISYVIVSDATNLREGLEAVGREFGIRRVSVQGGGILNGALLAEGLIDELSLVVYPGIDGLSGVPSIFEYMGGATEYPSQGQRLQLLSASRREHGVMWMRYEFHKD